MSNPPGKGVGKGKGKGPPPPPKACCTSSRTQLEGGSRAKGSGKAVAAAPVEVGPKLRPLFWQSISQVPSDSVFTQLQPPAPFDACALERHFALSQSHAASSSANAAAKRPAVTEDSRKRFRILDERSSQLLAIAFSRLPPPEQLGSILRNLSDFPDCLHAEAVLSLHNAAMEQQEAVEQIRQLQVHATELSQLGEAERYLWVLGVVPDSAAKLACGALIVGHAKELIDLRLAAERVGQCCQALRESDLVHRTVSTSLAVGNFMNRGTSRSEARAVVLPEALLKFEELRGHQEGDDGSTTPRAVSTDAPKEGGRGPTLLDIVAQALVNETAATNSGSRASDLLRGEAAKLKEKAAVAAKVDLDEAVANCKQALACSEKAKRAIQSLLAPNSAPSPGTVSSLAARVTGISSEAEDVFDKVQKAKRVLDVTMQWSSSRAATKGSDWFAGWAAFFDQLAAALARTRLPPRPEEPTKTPPAGPVPASRPALRELAVPSVQPQRVLDAGGVNGSEVPPRGTSKQDQAHVKASRGVRLDDDARLDADALKSLMGKPGELAAPAASESKGTRTRASGGARSTLFPGWSGAGKEN